MKFYNNGDELIDEIKNKWNRNLRSMRIWGFVASVFMILTGILSFIYPVDATYYIEILASIALLAFGIWEVVRYFQRPVFVRTGVSLASGILNILLAVLLLTSPASETLSTFGFLFGLDLLMLGFEQLTASFRFRAIGIFGTGWLAADGIMNIVIGMFLLLVPFASVFAISTIVAIYLIFGGVNLFIMSLNAKNLRK